MKEAAAKQNSMPALVKEVSTLVSGVAGIELGHRQAHMVESKLARRMMDLGIADADEYTTYLRANLNSEVPALVSLLTTHHTFFFREFFHFEYLEKEALPKTVEVLRKEGRKHIKVWSAACSRGQEVYSLSMCLDNWLKKYAPEFTYEILGSDIDPESVNFAKNGVYRWDEIKEIPVAYMNNHWARGTGEIADYVKAKASIKNPTKFTVVNLFDLAAKLTGQTFDLIFCRNVFIYFSQEQIKGIMNSFMNYLTPDGFVFLGISESLAGIPLPVAHLGQSIYTKKKAQLSVVPASVGTSAVPASATRSAATPAPAPTLVSSRPAVTPSMLERKLRVMCVDDSSVITSLLKKLLAPEFGFEVVTTAENGLDAMEKMKQHKVDLITLDIHMPGMTGIEYLQKNFGPSHPPVVMVSSVSRENAELALKAIELGAKDYIEKPSFSDLAKRGEEIRMKLRCAAQPELTPVSSGARIERSFQAVDQIKDPEKKMRVVIAGIGDIKKLTPVLKEFRGPQPPTVILIRGAESALPALLPQLKVGGWSNVLPISEAAKGLVANTIYLADYGKDFAEFRRGALGKRTSILVFGAVSKDLLHEMTSWPVSQLAIEELHPNIKAVGKQAEGSDTHVVPCTSFSYLSESFLSKD